MGGSLYHVGDNLTPVFDDDDQSEYPSKRIKLDLEVEPKRDEVATVELFPMDVQHWADLMACHVFDQQINLWFPAVVTLDSRSVFIRSQPGLALMANNPRYQLDSKKTICLARWHFQSISFVKKTSDQMIVKLHMHRPKLNVTFDFDNVDSLDKFVSMLLEKVPQLAVFNPQSFVYFLGEEMLGKIKQSFDLIGRPFTQFYYIANGDREQESIIIDKMIKELRFEFTQNLELMKKRMKIKDAGYKLILKQYAEYISFKVSR